MEPSQKKTVKIKRQLTGRSFRLLDFHIFDQKSETESDESSVGSGEKQYKPPEPSHFVIQMFGINEKGETACIYVDNYKPFFYLRVGDDWTRKDVVELLHELRSRVGKYHAASVLSVELVDHYKLYGFSGGKKKSICEDYLQKYCGDEQGSWSMVYVFDGRRAKIFG